MNKQISYVYMLLFSIFFGVQSVLASDSIGERDYPQFFHFTLRVENASRTNAVNLDREDINAICVKRELDAFMEKATKEGLVLDEKMPQQAVVATLRNMLKIEKVFVVEATLPSTQVYSVKAKTYQPEKDVRFLASATGERMKVRYFVPVRVDRQPFYFENESTGQIFRAQFSPYSKPIEMYKCLYTQ